MSASVIPALACLGVMFGGGCSSSARRAPAAKYVIEPLEESLSEHLLRLHNLARWEHYKEPLQIAPALDAYASTWAQSMAASGRMNHSQMSFRSRSGFGWAAENVAAYQSSVEDVMRSWRSSAGHRTNILNPRFRFAGFGMARDASGQPYWIAVFGG